MTTHNKLFARCYYAFFVSGLSVLLVGAIMPYLIAECGISYAVAGSFLSCFAIGNLLASFFTPYLAGKIGRKKTVVLLSSLVPLCFFIILLVPPVTIINLAFLVAGIGRGSISNINNAVINDYTNGKTSTLNILHTFFAIGAFVGPLLTSTVISLGFSWKYALITSIILSITAVIGYATMPLQDEVHADVKEVYTAKEVSHTNAFLKSIDFYLIGFLLFFYLGLENCINGWFITYLKDMGIMTEFYATNLLSILWIVVIAGRLSCAYLAGRFSKKLLVLINSIGCLLFFIMLISSQNIVFITICMIGLGFFLAGIYPTSIANAGSLIKGCTKGMAMLLAISGLGGIIMPQIVGLLADQIGMAGAMAFLALDAGIILVLAIINAMRKVLQ